MRHALMENRNGLVVDFQLSQASSTAERDIAPKLVDEARQGTASLRDSHPVTSSADTVR